MSAKPKKSLPHLVLGGELENLDGHEFRDLSKVDLVGAYGTYDEALRAWRTKAQQTVDNALMRYFIIHAHKLLDPGKDPQQD